MAITKMPIIGVTYLLRNRISLLPVQQVRWLQLPCKTTTNKAATLASAKIPKTETKLTDNLRLINIKTNSPSTTQKPLVVILEWLMAKKKHVHKFADIYLNHGFEVLSVTLKPSQLIWPVKGSKIVAASLLDVLHSQYASRPMLIHGFSVGGYLWGEVQRKMAEDIARYERLINSISGVVWDSVVDINEAAVGVPVALFPKNAILRNACRKYILYHLKKFEKDVTCHWRNSRDQFYRPIVQCPALLLYSEADPIGNPTSYNNLRAIYNSLGIKVFYKCWEKSPHVAHYAYYREEYVENLELFMEHIGLLPARKTERIRMVAHS